MKLEARFEGGGTIDPRCGSGVLLKGWTHLVLTAGHVLRPRSAERLVELVVVARNEARVHEVGAEAAVWFDVTDPVFDLGLVALSGELDHSHQPGLSTEDAAEFQAKLCGYPKHTRALSVREGTFRRQNGLYRYLHDIGDEGMSGGAVVANDSVLAVHVGKPNGYGWSVATPVLAMAIVALQEHLAEVWSR